MIQCTKTPRVCGHTDCGGYKSCRRASCSGELPSSSFAARHTHRGSYLQHDVRS